MPSRRIISLLALLAMLALLAAGCGGDDDDDDDGGSSTEPAPATAEPDTASEELAAADARATLEDLLAALGEKDSATACDQLTDEAAASFLAAVGAGGNATDCEATLNLAFTQAGGPILAVLAGAEIGEVIVTDDTATAAITVLGNTVDVPLEREDGEWNVAGLPALAG